MTKFLKVLLPLLFILQVAVSAGFELAHDEAYYWLFSRHLDWGYFDHPPFMAVIIKLFSFLPHAEWSVRLGFIILQFLTLLALFGFTAREHWTRTTILFFAFPLASLTGLLALPDLPLLFMTALYCYSLKLYLEKRDTPHALLLGVIIALLLYAKYHGILLVFFTIVALPRLFHDKRFYLIALVSILLFLPHVWWQYQHDFATLRYHFLERPSSGFSLARIGEYLATQVFLPGLFAGPIVWWAAIKRRNASEFDRAMKFISLGVVAFFLISTLSKKFETNWTIFLAVPLIYLSVSSGIWERKVFKGLLYTSFGIVVVARLLFILPTEIINMKRLKEFKGWKEWSLEVKQRCGDKIVANSYQIASKLSFYLNEEVHALNYHSRKNQFDFWRWDLNNPSKSVCYITDKREFQGEILKTPEGKELLLIKNQNYADLLARKEASMR